METSSKRWAGRELYLIIVVAAVALYVNLGGWGVTETSEARFAEISYEMYQSGDYLHPRLLSIQHYHKPPVIYWITALAYHLFGPSTFAARFFLQIAVLLQIILVYHLTLLFFNKRQPALLSVLFYLSFTGLAISSRSLTADAWLNTFILGAIYFQTKRRITPRIKWFYAVCFLLGLGFMTKGPVVFIVPVFVFPLINYHWPLPSKAFTWHNAGGIALFFITALPWYIYLFALNPLFFDYFVVEHTINRFASEQFNRNQSFWFFFALLPAITSPWLFLNVAGIKSYFHKPLTEGQILWIWIVGTLLFFSLSSSKLILYILPVLPALAILTALNWQKLTHKAQVKWNVVLFIYHSVVLAALLLAAVFSPNQLRFNTGMWISAGFMAILLLYQLYKISTPFRGIWVAALFTLSLTGFSTFFLGNHPDLANDTLPVARFVEEVLLPDGKIFVYNKRLPSLAFNTKRMTISVSAGDNNLKRETIFEENDEWQEYLIDAASEVTKNDEFFVGSVLIARQNEKNDSQFKAWSGQYLHKNLVNKWVVYYN